MARRGRVDFRTGFSVLIVVEEEEVGRGKGSFGCLICPGLSWFWEEESMGKGE